MSSTAAFLLRLAAEHNQFTSAALTPQPLGGRDYLTPSGKRQILLADAVYVVLYPRDQISKAEDLYRAALAEVGRVPLAETLARLVDAMWKVHRRFIEGARAVRPELLHDEWQRAYWELDDHCGAIRPVAKAAKAPAPRNPGRPSQNDDIVEYAQTSGKTIPEVLKDFGKTDPEHSIFKSQDPEEALRCAMKSRRNKSRGK